MDTKFWTDTSHLPTCLIVHVSMCTYGRNLTYYLKSLIAQHKLSRFVLVIEDGERIELEPFLEARSSIDRVYGSLVLVAPQLISDQLRVNDPDTITLFDTVEAAVQYYQSHTIVPAAPQPGYRLELLNVLAESASTDAGVILVGLIVATLSVFPTWAIYGWDEFLPIQFLFGLATLMILEYVVRSFQTAKERADYVYVVGVAIGYVPQMIFLGHLIIGHDLWTAYLTFTILLLCAAAALLIKAFPELEGKTPTTD